MANHGYVIPKSGNLPSVEEFDSFVRQVVQEHFPCLVVDSSHEDLWYVHHPEYLVGYFGSQFWFDKFVSTQPCIEFRHGHCGCLGWWLEDEIRTHIAKKYDALVADSGDDLDSVEPCYEVGKNLLEYINWYFRSAKHKDLLVALEVDAIFSAEPPEDLIKIMGVSQKVVESSRRVSQKVVESSRRAVKE